jgi:hypothetical protein
MISHREDAGKNDKGASQPPKKQMAIIIESQSILLYSAKKNIAKAIEEYSTL